MIIIINRFSICETFNSRAESHVQVARTDGRVPMDERRRRCFGGWAQTWIDGRRGEGRGNGIRSRAK